MQLDRADAEGLVVQPHHDGGGAPLDDGGAVALDGDDRNRGLEGEGRDRHGIHPPPAEGVGAWPQRDAISA